MWSKHGRGGPKTANSISSAAAELEIAIRLLIAPRPLEASCVRRTIASCRMIRENMAPA